MRSNAINAGPTQARPEPVKSTPLKHDPVKPTLPKAVGRILAALALTIGVIGPGRALDPGQTVDNFRLLDQRGESHELRALADRKAIVVMIQGNGCPIVRKALPALAEVRARYRDQRIEFLLLNPNLQDTRESVAKEAAEFRIDFPILLDESQRIGEALGVTRTSEVFVIDPKDWKLAYRGPMDDRLSYERQRPAQHHYLRDALDSMLAGTPVKTPYADGVGCLVNFPKRDRQGLHPPGDQVCVSCARATLTKGDRHLLPELAPGTGKSPCSCARKRAVEVLIAAIQCRQMANQGLLLAVAAV